MKKNFFYAAILLTGIILTSCDASANRIKQEGGETLKEAVTETFSDRSPKPYVNELGDYCLYPRQKWNDLSLEMNIETRRVIGLSAEGGEMTRYEDESGKLFRYQLTFYGEMGRIESDFYFVDDLIYYSSLLEAYNMPIYNIPGTSSSEDPGHSPGSSAETWGIAQQTLTEGIRIDGIYYEYNRERDEVLQTEVLDSVETPDELDELFEDLSEVLSLP